jgi:type IV pilus assembly protein PilC
MPIFTYRAKDKQGILKEGVVEADSLSAAADILHDHGLSVLALQPETGEIHLERYIPFLKHVSRKELVLFSRQLATLINARVPINQALDVLRLQLTNRELRKVLEEILHSVEGGKSLSESIADYPHVFSNLYVNMVKSGELSGTLDEALTYLADQQEKDYDLVSKIRGALTYPIFIVSAIIIVGTLMFIFVLPQMTSVLKEAGAELPLTTRILISSTEILQKYWVVLVLILIGLVMGFRIYIQTSGGRLIWDALKLKIPIVGKLLHNIYIDRLCLNLSTLVTGGIPIVQALRTVGEVVGNKVLREIIYEAAAEVETGKSMAAVFSEHKEIPPILCQMARVGEQTGSLGEILGKLARFYDKEVDNSLSTLTTLLEPVIMMLLGLAVAVMVAGILLPIYNLAGVQ